MIFGEVLQHFLARRNGFCDQLLLEIVTQKSSKILRKSDPEGPRSLQNQSGTLSVRARAKKIQKIGFRAQKGIWGYFAGGDFSAILGTGREPKID